MPAYGKVHRGIWNDPEFRDLTPYSKLLYIHFISHPKLTKVGVIDIHEDRWARAIGVEDVTPFVRELEAGRFVILDRDTEELAIRTYVKNDGFVGNWKMICAMWRSWEGVESDALRVALVANMPEEVWISENAQPPKSAWSTKAQVDSQSIANAIGNPIANRTPMASTIPPATAPVTTPVDDNAFPSALPRDEVGLATVARIRSALAQEESA